MNWRYQPVWVELGGERLYSLCEVYLDDDGRLEQWTAESRMVPVGDNRHDLKWTLAAMLQDLGRWEPVDFDKLQVGMSFERRQEDMEADALSSAVGRWLADEKQKTEAELSAD